MNMLAVIAPKSDQINADDLIGQTMTVTIEDVDVRPGTEQPVAMRLRGTDKLFRPCKGVCRLIVAMWGADTSAYIGCSLTLYRDPDVTWGGVKVGGIRISHASHIDSKQVHAIAESRKVRRPMTVLPLIVEKPAAADDTAARAWLTAHMAQINAAASIDALDAITAKAGKALAKMAAQFPALRDEAVACANARSAVLAFEPEGPADTDRGESFATDGAENAA